MSRKRQTDRSKVRKARPTLTGTIRIARPGSASVETPEGVFPIARGGIHEAMDGDEVQVVLVGQGSEARKAVVQGVLQRSISTFLGTYEIAEPLGVVVPLDPRLKHDFFVLPEDESPHRNEVADGDIVSARILQYPSRNVAGVATIDRRVGTPAELDMSIETIIASHGIVTEFPQSVLDEARELKVDVAQAFEEHPSRRDLRDRCTFTIDPADARDFDDALDCCRLPDGGFEIGVHIADVTHYVAWGSSIDLEARLRTCSTYLVDRVIPMLPERLCNDVCSLKPAEDRLCMTVLIRLDENAKVISHEAFRSVIHSHARLNYDEVDQLLEGTLPEESLTVSEGSPHEVAEAIRSLDEFAHLRALVRERRGAIDFETSEAKVILDHMGRPVDVRVRKKTRGTSLVEEAMLLANECVARTLVNAGIGAAFRVHERPSPESLAETVPILRELGIVQGKEVDRLIAGEPEAIRGALQKADGTNNEYLVNALLLRAQKRAIYLPHNDGHYALGAKAYCHFTSPIRRYPDVIVHRALKAVIDGQKGSPEQRSIGKLLSQLCRTCSDQERVADTASRDSQKAKMAELYSGRIGERYSGIVVGCERYGLFVMLDDTCAEGLLPTRALGEEWFTYDATRMALIGENTGRVWRLGQRVAVQIEGTNPSLGQIDFSLPHERATDEG